LDHGCEFNSGGSVVITEFHWLANIFPLVEGAEFDELVADIRQHGLHEPIVIYEDKILDGRNQLRACQVAGVEPTFTVYTGDDPVAYVISLNLRRRHLDESQRAMVAAKLAILGHGGDRSSGKFAACSVPTQQEAATLLNISERTVRSAREVQEHGSPELVSAVERGAVSVAAAADVATLPAQEQQEIVARGEREILRAALEIRQRKGEIRRAARIERLIEVSKGNAPLGLEQKYPIILADPPWRYEHPTFGSSRDIEEHYPTLELEEICALPVAALAAESALLFLWVPPPKLEEAFQVIAAWGFDYRTGIVWVKHSIGMGNYVRQRCEHLLIARRGEFPTPAPAQRPDSVIEAPRREHSRKPDEAYELIERMYPELPKIELFARQARAKWRQWGNEIAREAAGEPLPKSLRHKHRIS
jgi:N6-adenosine-specific RNA methylase IME4